MHMAIGNVYKYIMRRNKNYDEMSEDLALLLEENKRRNNNENNTFSPQPFEEYKKQEQDNKLVSLDLGRAHFFMNWNLDKEKDVNAPYLDFRNDEKLFKTWLTDSMKYIDSELSFLINKHPKKNC